MMWAKYIDKNTIECIDTKRLVLEDKQIFNPTNEILASLGYLEVVFKDYPDQENNYQAFYTIKNNKIIQNWEIKEDV